MWAWIIGGLALLFALDSEQGRDKARAATAVKLGADGKPEKVKGPDDWKAEGRKEADAAHKAERDREKQLRKVIRREMRYRPPETRAAAGGEDE